MNYLKWKWSPKLGYPLDEIDGFSFLSHLHSAWLEGWIKYFFSRASSHVVRSTSVRVIHRLQAEEFRFQNRKLYSYIAGPGWRHVNSLFRIDFHDEKTPKKPQFGTSGWILRSVDVSCFISRQFLAVRIFLPGMFPIHPRLRFGKLGTAANPQFFCPLKRHSDWDNRGRSSKVWQISQNWKLSSAFGSQSALNAWIRWGIARVRGIDSYIKPTAVIKVEKLDAMTMDLLESWMYHFHSDPVSWRASLKKRLHFLVRSN